MIGEIKLKTTIPVNKDKLLARIYKKAHLYWYMGIILEGDAKKMDKRKLCLFYSWAETTQYTHLSGLTLISF